MLQPITALSQRVQVPPQQGSRQLRRDTRLRRGVTCGGESSGVQVSATSKGVGLVERRATLRAGAQAKAGKCVERWTCQEARDRTMREPSPTSLGEGDDDGEGPGPVHPSFPPAYRHWHAEKGEWLKVGTVSMAAQTKSSGKGPRYNQATPGKSEGVVEIRTSGHGSEDGKDSITFPERRTRGSRWSLSCARGGLGTGKGQQSPQEGHRRRRPCQTTVLPRGYGLGV
jgi:hypothetical protein